MGKYENIQWVVEMNTTQVATVAGDDYFGKIKSCCESNGIDFIPIRVIPFSGELPSFPMEKQSIFYGGTTLSELASKIPNLKAGVFLNENFSIENYLSKWGELMLNSDAIFTTFGELSSFIFTAYDRLFFIRPDADDKSFAGCVKSFEEIWDWSNRLVTFGNDLLNNDTKIIASTPYNIKYEYRIWVINGVPVESSKYCENFTVTKERGCPQGVLDFVKKACSIYTPSDVFVMDVALCGDEYFIIECNCVNSSGFYAASIETIILTISDYFIKKQ